MNPRVSILCVAILALPLTGCMIAQVPTRHPVEGKKDMSFIEKGKTTRSEVQTGLGFEDAYYPDLRVACYIRNDVTYRMWLFFLFFPIDSRPGQTPSHDLALIHYDEQEHVRRIGTARGVWTDDWQKRAEKIAGVKKLK